MTKLQNIKHEAEKIRLSSAEKSAMRAAIFGTQSPLVQGKVKSYLFMSYHVRMSLAGVMLFVLAGSGTVSAAQGALPGDILYSVKISVNEKVEEVLAPTSAAKMEVAVRQAERRVEEARELSVRGRLDERTAKTLTDDFDEHVARALAFAEDDDDDSDDGKDEFEDVADDKEVPLSAESSKKSGSVQTMTLSVMAPEAGRATTTPERSVKKSSGKRESLKESLRAKAEILKEIKSGSQRQEIRDDHSDEDEEEDN